MAIKLRSYPEQVAEAILKDMVGRQWVDVLPGIDRLSRHYGVKRSTIHVALKILEEQKLLTSHGSGKVRKIRIPEDFMPRQLRVGIMRHELKEIMTDEFLVELRHSLERAGHVVVFAPQCLSEMNMDPERVAASAQSCDVDAWVVAVASEQVLQWFLEQPIPAISVTGMHKYLPIAGISPNARPQWLKMFRRMVDLGHERILCMSRATVPNEIERQLAGNSSLKTVLEESGIPLRAYHWPYIGNDPATLYRVLDELFRTEPPTAMFVDEAFLAHVIYQYLLDEGMRVPEDVSLVCSDKSVVFEWGRPSITSMRWCVKPMVKRVLRWVDHVSRGERDVSQVGTRVEFVEGDSLAAVTGGREK